MNDAAFVSCMSSIRRRCTLSDAQAIHELVLTGEVSSPSIRDFNLDKAFYDALFCGMSLCWAARLPGEDAEWLLLQIWAAVGLLPEFVEAEAIAAATESISPATLLKRLEWGSVRNAALVVDLLAWLYCCSPCKRSSLRIDVGTWLDRQLHQGEAIKHAHVQLILQFLAQIINGMGRDMGSVDELAPQRGSPEGRAVLVEILQKLLLPLHLESGMLEWRDQVPIIKPYHESLVLCIARSIEYEQSMLDTPSPDSSILSQTIQFLFEFWPESFQANTPKEVLFIHEVEKILSMATPDEFSHLLKPFLVMALPTPQGATVSINSFLIAEENIHRAKTRQCISSSAYLAMFQVFRNDRLVDLMIPHLDIIVSELLGPLYRGGELFWNPTVNKMTALVLQRLIDLDKDLVLRHADRINIGNLSVDRTVHSEAKATAFNESKFDSKNAAPAARIPISRTGLPRLSASLPRGSTPHPVRSHMAGWSPGQGTAPPVTVTGVAPWAQPPRGLPVLPNVPYNYPAPETEILRKEKQSVDDVVSNAQTRLFGYICRCKGLSEDGGDASNSGTIDWLAAQAAQTPTLLPDLKFHQLVFGRELGQGAFSIVKYARHIQPNKTRSQWPEYAVKVMSKRDLEALGRGFQDAAVREIAALSVLSHPGIARLISAFRYTDSIYLVLEYAAAGDLHSYIMVNGALNHYYTRFVMGEVGAALVSIHDMGLSFNDLKPENVLITENGHVKLTDFGACRPINESGQRALEIKNRELIRCIAKKPSSLDCSFFDHLRDGDWRETTTVSETANEAFLARSALEVDSVDNDLNTIEGTPGYLPPEVLRDGCIPDQLSDSWAFGCTMSFCLEGRPPFYGHTEQVLHQIYLRCQSKDEMKHSDASFSGEGVHFKEQDHNGHHSIVKRSRRLDGSNKADVFQIAFDDVMGGLLSVDFTRRKKIEDAIKHNYFTGHDIDTNEIVFMNPFQLHSLPPLRLPRLDAALEGGSSTASAGPVDKEWARRQLSSVWAPMPKVYDFSQQKPPSMNAVNNTQHVVMSLLGAIIEGLDEKNGAFLPATKIKHSRNTEFRMQPPVFE